MKFTSGKLLGVHMQWQILVVTAIVVTSGAVILDVVNCLKKWLLPPPPTVSVQS